MTEQAEAKVLTAEEAVAIFNRAVAAGHAAGASCVPEPMTVVGQFGDRQFEEYVPEGVCGFAWVKVAGSSSFLRAMKKAGLVGEFGQWSPAYPNGYHYWVSQFGQSYERKMAFAKAMAESMRRDGVECSYNGRLD